MPRNYTLRRKFSVRSKEFLICGRADARHAIHLKLCETGGGGAVLSEIHVSLDAAMELCDRLAEYDDYYRAYRPLPAADAVLRRSTLAADDSAYLVELTVRNYRQCVTITQDRERRTRSAPPVISVPDMRRFRLELTDAVDALAAANVPLFYRLSGDVIKVARGNWVAVLSCAVRPWPWCHSAHTERLLFEHELVRMILDKQDAGAVQEYCERRYPHLVTEAYHAGPAATDDGAGQRRVLDEFKCLSVRWVRIGAEFRVNRPTGGVVLRHEDHWFTA